MSKRSPETLRVWRRRANLVLIQGALLTCFLVMLRALKVNALLHDTAAELDWVTWCQLLLPEVGFLLTVGSAWLLLARVEKRWLTWLWPYGFVGTTAFVYVLATATHRFYVMTLMLADIGAISYALHEFSTLKGVLAVGVDAGLLWPSVVGAAFVASSAWVWRKPWALPGATNVLVPAVATLVGSVLMFLPAPDQPILGLLAHNLVVDVLPNPNLQQFEGRVVPTRRLYQKPHARFRDPAQRTSAPNFLLIILESTRRDVLAAYGGNPKLSPFLNSLSKYSVVVDDLYTTISHTSKALVGIHCGMYPRFTMKLFETSPGGLPIRCLPSVLRDLGYESGFFQAAGNFENRETLTKNMGFGHVFVPSEEDAKGFSKSGYLGYEEAIWIKPALEWIRARKKPYFATVLTLATHHPYEAPTDPKPTGGFDSYQHAALYVDQVVQKLMRQLAESGALKNTIVIVTADHGESFGDHFGFRQHDRVPYEEVDHVPLFMFAPERLGKPRRIGGLRQHLDLMPTLLGLAGAVHDGQLPGMDLLSTDGHPFVVTGCWMLNGCLSLRREDTSYVFHFGRIPLQVFDLSKDPRQQHDIAGQVPLDSRETAIDFMLGTHVSAERVYQGGASPAAILE